MKSTSDVVIAGAGIGGLTAAIALTARGHDVRVLERAPSMSGIGAGIALAPNAMFLLDRLGVADQVTALGERVDRMDLLTDKGALLGGASSRELGERIGAPTVAIHRAALQSALLEALGSDRVQTGARVVGFEQDEHQVTVSIADGARETARVLIGADGIHSQIRAQLHGDRAPRYSGYTCWRGVTEALPEPPSTMSESWGSGRRFGIVPIGGRCVYWFATLNAPSGGRDNLATLHADLQRIFEAFHKPVAELIESTPSHQILRNDIIDREPLRTWGQGRVTLLGDAAHAMTPNLVQGACQAIEDAAYLAHVLCEPVDPVSALRQYEAIRLKRTRKLVTRSYDFGRLAQLENPVGRFLRNFAISCTPASLTLRSTAALLEEGIEWARQGK